MAARKSPKEKLQTKLKKIVTKPLIDNEGTVKFEKTVLFVYNKDKFTYSRFRYYPTKIENLIEDNYEVEIPLNDVNLKYISTTGTNPPPFLKVIVKYISEIENVGRVVLGSDKNVIKSKTLHITSQLFDELLKINSEEGRDKNARLKNRVSPFLETAFGKKLKRVGIERDYGVLLKEIIASKKVSQQDLIAISSQLEKGNSINVVIAKQVNKQVEWLLTVMEDILENAEISKDLAKDLGNKHFGFPKTSINGAEHLMEMILTKYGQYTLFGVPAMLNTNKYVIHGGGLSRSQFDLVLVTHVGEIEVVELKRPDKWLLDYDSGRKKFYPSKDLSIAIAQAERYISSVMKDNDDEYLIDGKKIRQFLKDELGGTLFIETVRPSALIVMGSSQHIHENYDDLKPTIKKSVKKSDFNENGSRAFRELKNTFKNISILTYSELLEHARTRLQLTK